MRPPEVALTILRCAAHDDQIVGIHGIPGRLPELRRLPGESVMGLCLRARCALVGTKPTFTSMIVLPPQ